MMHAMVVDDDEMIRSIVTDCLRDAGWTVCEAANGREALAALNHERPDLILLDLMMPVMDGRSFAEACSRMMSPELIPILLLSAAHGVGDIAEHMRRLGVGGYLTKPFDVQMLLDAAENLVPQVVKAA